MKTMFNLRYFLAGPKTRSVKKLKPRYNKEQYTKDIERLLKKGIIKKIEDEEENSQFVTSYTR